MAELTRNIQPYFDNEVLHRINDINVMLQKLFHAFYTPYGLTYVQVPVLMALRRQGKMRVSELGKTLEIGSSNITPLCKRLERAGLVTRTRSDEDQRVVYVEITDTSLRILEQIEKEIANRMPKIDNVSKEDNQIIIQGLDTLYNNLKGLAKITFEDHFRF